MRVVVAVDGRQGADLAAGLERDGIDVLAVVEASGPALAVDDGMLGADAARITRALVDADALLLEITRDSISTGLVGACDRAGVRILPLCAREGDERVAAAYALSARFRSPSSHGRSPTLCGLFPPRDPSPCGRRTSRA